MIHSLNDRKDFEKVMWLTDNKPIEVDYTSNIIKAFNYFYENIKPEKYDIDAILAHIVFIAIELQENDDEQAIFDTINSLGVRLTTAELLKTIFSQSILAKNTKNFGDLYSKGAMRFLYTGIWRLREAEPSGQILMLSLPHI